MKVENPAEYWRERKAEERSDFLAGKIPESDCYMERLFPDAFIEVTDLKLKAFAASIAACGLAAADYPRVMAAIMALVLELNEINNDFGGSVIETGEREALCQFIDDVIVAHGIDIAALAASQDCEVNELTDAWRDW